MWFSPVLGFALEEKLRGAKCCKFYRPERVLKMEIPEIEEVLEDKYQAMKHTKGWEEEVYDYALFARPSNEKGPRKLSKNVVDTVEKFDTKQLIVPTRKAIKIRVRNRKQSKTI